MPWRMKKEEGIIVSDEVWYRGHHLDSERKEWGPPWVGLLGLKTQDRRPITEVV
jgi:hypothetical protein